MTTNLSTRLFAISTKIIRVKLSFTRFIIFRSLVCFLVEISVEELLRWKESESTRTKRNSSIPSTIKSINLSYTFSLNRWSPRHAKTKRSQGNHRCTQMQTPPRSSTTVSSWTGLVYVTGDPSERSPTWHTVEKHKLVGNGTNVRKIDGQREPSDKAKRDASAVKSTESRKHVSFKRNATGEDNTSLIQL